MGLDINGTKFLLYARSRGVSFDAIAMIGRQEMLISPKDLAKNLRRFGLQFSNAEIDEMAGRPGIYAESFLQAIGARNVVSFDASDYESASEIHDFNQPIPDKFKGSFSCVLDGGTLEHIFNFPTAIRNCMEMVAEGGHFLAITPTNNHSGHGLYQFSPELFFRIFSKENGFSLEHLIVFEETLTSPWYEVADPRNVRQRVQIINESPTMLLVIARKVKTVEIFRSMPQQSDYVAVWTDGDSPDRFGPRAPSGAISKLSRIPSAVIRRIRLKIDRKTGMLNRRPQHFKKVDLP